MAAAIGRSIKAGFAVGNKSWAGMAAYAGGWVIVGLFAAGLFFLTGSVAPVPQELIEAFHPPAEQSAPLAQEPLSPPVDEESAVETPTTDTALPVSSVEEQLQIPPSNEPEPRLDLDDERIMQLAGEWLGRAWPFVALLVVGLMVAASWLYAGQLGYMTKQVCEGSAPIAELWHAANRAVGPLLAGSLLSLLATVVGALIIGAIAWLLSLLPEVAGMVLGAVLFVAVGVAVVWLLVSVTFWFIAIVADRLGPIAGLKASFRTVRSQWWKTLGLLACLMLIALALALPLGIVEGIGNTVGGVGGSILVAVSNLLQLVVVNVYFGFVFSAASIRYYEDAKAV